MIKVIAKHERRKEAQTFDIAGKLYTSQTEVKEDFERTHPRYKVSKVESTDGEFEDAKEELAIVADHLPKDAEHVAPVNDVKE